MNWIAFDCRFTAKLFSTMINWYLRKVKFTVVLVRTGHKIPKVQAKRHPFDDFIKRSMERNLRSIACNEQVGRLLQILD